MKRRHAAVWMAALACVGVAALSSLVAVHVTKTREREERVMDDALASQTTDGDFARASALVSLALDRLGRARPPPTSTSNDSLPSGEAPYDGPTWVLSKDSTLRIRTTVRLENVNGWPVCTASGMCIRLRPEKDATVAYLPKLTIMPSPLAEAQTKTTMRDRRCGERGRHGFHARSKSPMPANVTWLRGTTLVLDTVIASEHFGHVGHKVMQAFQLMRALGPEHRPDRVLFLQQSRYPSPARDSWRGTTQMVKLMLEKEGYLATNRSAFRPDMQYAWGGWVCMERYVEVRRVSERVFATPAEFQPMRDHVAAWAGWKPSSTLCPRGPVPPSRVVVLHRDPREGKGDRRFVNFDAVASALRRVGVCAYENVTLRSGTPLAEQIRVFWDAALVVAPHSSQLVSAAFASRVTAVVELRADGPETSETDVNADAEWGRIPSPFCPAKSCPPVYVVSFRHALMREDRRPATFRDPLWVNEDALVRDLEAALREQRERWVAAGCSSSSSSSSSSAVAQAGSSAEWEAFACSDSS